MRNLINLIESNLDLDPEAEEDALSQSYDREKHVEALIRYAFTKIGLPVNYNNYSVSYDDSTREAEVQLEDQEVSVEQLTKLAATGLAEGSDLAAYRVVWGSDALSIHFTAAKALDNAQIPTE
jgi:hypothetical protein